MDSLRSRIADKPHLAGLDILSLAKPSIRLTARRVSDRELQRGASRIGGTPDVPSGWDWPRWMPTKVYKFRPHPEHLAPLGFIAQIDLSTLPRFDDSLPETGWLYFFYDRYCEPWSFDPRIAAGAGLSMRPGVARAWFGPSCRRILIRATKLSCALSSLAWT
jgi:hypothetical protein